MMMMCGARDDGVGALARWPRGRARRACGAKVQFSKSLLKVLTFL